MTIKLNSSGGGSVSIDAPNTGSTRTITLPDDANSGVIKTSTYPSSIQVLEQFFTPCDGSVIATSAGNVTVQDVDATQLLTTAFVDATGSIITYTPPTGTTQVIYEFHFQISRDDAHSISHWNFYIDSDEATDAYSNYSAQQNEQRSVFKWGINIGGTAVAATGRLASWTSSKTLKLQAREYHASDNAARIHETEYSDGTGTNIFCRPCIGITAIGAA